MSGTYLLQLFVSFIVLGGVLFALMKAGKKIQSRRYSGEIKIKDRVSLSQHTSVVLMEFRGDSFLLGIGGKDISIIEKLK